jgi:4-amino-4-deoxy-L-arabinose transferase-like glycosyltransferase
MRELVNQKTKNVLVWISATFILWRLALLIIVFAGNQFLPLREGYLGGGTAAYLKNPLLWSWANFDGAHYLTIAKEGYYQFQQAFFPFYPYLLRSLSHLTKNYLFSGLLISHLSLLAALFLFYRLVNLDFNEKIAKRSLIYLLLFPTSFYFGGVYTESLFLALILGSFYAARKKQWVIAGILGALASATRFVGIFLFPALLLEWSQGKEKSKKRKIKSFLPLLLILSGLLIYMWYLNKTVGDPLYFIHVQPFFGAQRTGGKIILLYQVFWRYLKMLVTVEKMTPTYFVCLLEFFSGLAFLVLTIFTYLRLRLSYFVFMALAYLVPTLTGTFSSLPRYVLICFPGFILLSLWSEKYRWLKRLYPVIAVIFLVVSVILFARGFFVA